MRKLIVSGVLLMATAMPSSAKPPGSPDGAWLVPDAAALRPAPPPGDAQTREELAKLRELATQREASRARIAYWDTGAPSYRWNEIAVGELVRRGAPTPVAGRHMALLHAAIHDALVAVWDAKVRYRRPRPSVADPTFAAAAPTPPTASYPAEHAAAAAAAAEVLGLIFADKAATFARLAEEAAQSRLIAGLHYPSDVEAGLALGRAVAAYAVERAKNDGFDAKWAGTVPNEAGKWTGVKPALPMAGQWKTWVLAQPDALRPPPPPAPGSSELMNELAEIKAVQRTPGQTSAAWFWEFGAGSFRGFQFWNEQTSRLTLERGLAPLEAAQAYALESVAFHDATVACWEAKYHYWAVRPFMLDPELKELFPAPNHPSYPAGHGCLSTAAAVTLAGLFPEEAERLLAMSDEAAEARIWAGIHFRSDIEAGKAIGRAVGEQVLALARAR